MVKILRMGIAVLGSGFDFVVDVVRSRGEDGFLYWISCVFVCL